MPQQLVQTILGWVQKQLNMPKVAVEQAQSDIKALQPPNCHKGQPKNLNLVARTRRNGRF